MKKAKNPPIAKRALERHIERIFIEKWLEEYMNAHIPYLLSSIAGDGYMDSYDYTIHKKEIKELKRLLVDEYRTETILIIKHLNKILMRYDSQVKRHEEKPPIIQDRHLTNRIIKNVPYIIVPLPLKKFGEMFADDYKKINLSSNYAKRLCKVMKQFEALRICKKSIIQTEFGKIAVYEFNNSIIKFLQDVRKGYDKEDYNYAQPNFEQQKDFSGIFNNINDNLIYENYAYVYYSNFKNDINVPKTRKKLIK
ncbi:MAG: hypothetical protein ATN36_03775 [Epulopiscium sp. Nele67-Bin005]|nr:MAG: hypothetical protein ATN36_03775 [Epulopiscium sp. Nele67-Bin005]